MSNKERTDVVKSLYYTASTNPALWHGLIGIERPAFVAFLSEGGRLGDIGAGARGKMGELEG